MQKNTQKSIFIFPLRPFPPSQCYRVAIVGSLVEKAAFQGEQGDRRSITLALSTIVKASYNFFYTRHFSFSLAEEEIIFFLNIPFDFWSGFLEHHCLWSRWHCIWSNINQLSISTSIISQQSQYLLLLMASRLVSINLAWLPITHSSIIEKFPLSLIHPETLLETSRLVLCSVGFKHLSVKKWFLDRDPESSYTNI